MLKKLGIPEVVLFVVALLFIVGPARPPSLGKALGEAQRALKGALFRKHGSKGRGGSEL